MLSVESHRSSEVNDFMKRTANCRDPKVGAVAPLNIIYANSLCLSCDALLTQSEHTRRLDRKRYSWVLCRKDHANKSAWLAVVKTVRHSFLLPLPRTTSLRRAWARSAVVNESSTSVNLRTSVLTRIRWTLWSVLFQLTSSIYLNRGEMSHSSDLHTQELAKKLQVVSYFARNAVSRDRVSSPYWETENLSLNVERRLTLSCCRLTCGFRCRRQSCKSEHKVLTNWSTERIAPRRVHVP